MIELPDVGELSWIHDSCFSGVSTGFWEEIHVFFILVWMGRSILLDGREFP